MTSPILCRSPSMVLVVTALWLAAAASFDAQRPNRNHWTTDADIGRGDGPVDDQALRDAPSNPGSVVRV